RSAGADRRQVRFPGLAVPSELRKGWCAWVVRRVLGTRRDEAEGAASGRWGDGQWRGERGEGLQGPEEWPGGCAGGASDAMGTRRRWRVGFIDLGDAVMIVPGGLAAARAELRSVLRDEYEAGVAAIDDADLSDYSQ